MNDFCQSANYSSSGPPSSNNQQKISIQNLLLTNLIQMTIFDT